MDQIVQAVGFGTIGYGERRATTLQKASLTVVTNEECIAFFDDLISSELCTYDEVCDACQVYRKILLFGYFN